VGGDTHSDYYEGETHEIQGKVVGAMHNAKVTLYLDDKSEPIATANVQSDGSYVLKFTPEVNENIVKNKYALLSATDSEKTYNSIVAFYDSNSSNAYKYKDTTISSYTNAIYKIKTVLSFDKSTSKSLVRKFMLLSNKGNYDSTKANAYTFAYNGIMDELAEHPKYDNAKVFETIQTLSTLTKSQLLEAKRAKSKEYAFVVAKKIEGNVVVQEVTLDVNLNEPLVTEPIAYDLEKKVVGKTDIYDSARHYTFVTESGITLKKLKVVTLDSDRKTTTTDRIDDLDELKNGTKTFVIQNLKPAPKSSSSNALKSSNKNNQKVSQKISGSYSAVIYTHKILDLPTGLWEYWSYVGDESNIALLTDINFDTFLTGYDNKGRAMKVEWYTSDGTLSYTRYSFNDPENYYWNATVASKNMSETSYLVSPSITNSFKNEYEDSLKKWSAYRTPTHTIKDLDRIVTEDFAGGATSAWINSNYAQTKALNYLDNEDYDTRQPLLLIHGWQAVEVNAERNPAILRDYDHNEFEYWHNFIDYYLTTPELYTRYKLYTYHYASYKHISYNGEILKELLDELKQNYNTVLGRALWEDKLVIIGHSMGGLVARSMIEEHQGLGANAENLQKLITLDTPHHGSHGANQAHWSSDLADFIGSKDLGTAGSVDLIWDNYDSYYSHKAGKDASNYDQTLDENDGDSRYSLLGDNKAFDFHFLAKVPNLNNDDAINPYLAYLNKSFRLNWANKVNSNSGNKYIFYVAHSSGDQNFGNQVSNPIDTTYSYRTTTATFNSYGYASGGAEPVCSSFLSWETDENDKVTRFKGDFNDPSKFIDINNQGVEDNSYIPYRYFWDYDHQSIMAGRAHNNKDWDRFIDDKSSIASDECGLSSYYNFASSPSCGTEHYNYYLYAFNFLYDTTHEIDKQQIYGELSNPLTTEPVFMSLYKDLLTSYRGY